jgi:hypothetical protein
VRRTPGKKLPVGDILSSHISQKELCSKHIIAFVCLPANSTDKMQALDVGVFAPLKKAWRNQQQSYLEKDPSTKLLNKLDFPKMLKAVLWIQNIFFFNLKNQMQIHPILSFQKFRIRLWSQI